MSTEKREWPAEPWAIDPLDLGTPYNVDTADGKQSVCLVAENPAPNSLVINQRRIATAKRIVSCVNALAGVVEPEAAIKAAREALELARDEYEFTLGDTTSETFKAVKAALSLLNAKGERLQNPHKMACSHCGGSGVSAGVECKECHGSGEDEL